MKIDKEYPATHSMGTSWYAVDADGNVALMDYNDNGPVPMGCPEITFEGLVFTNPPSRIGCIGVLPYTKEQIEQMLQNAEPEKMECLYNSVYFVKESMVETFISKVQGLLKEDDDIVRLSKESNAFFIDVCSDEIETALSKMIEEGFFYKCVRCDYENYSEEIEADEIILDKKFEGFPFYIYEQPYYQGGLMYRGKHVPNNPVKIEQFDADVQRSMIKLPIRFSDTKKFQIAEHVPFLVNNPSMDKDGREYEELFLSNGETAYIPTTHLPLAASKPCETCQLCPDWYKCVGYNHYPIEFCKEPTVLIVHTYGECEISYYDYFEKRGQIYVSKSALIRLTHGFPGSEQRAADSPELVAEMFRNCKSYFEETIKILNPRVIIVQEKCVKILQEHYLIENNNILVNGENYPFYKEAEVEADKETINQLANLPYRGEILSRRITLASK